MKTRVLLAPLVALAFSLTALGADPEPDRISIEAPGLRAGFDPAGALVHMEGRAGRGSISWLTAPVRIQVLSEATAGKGAPAPGAPEARAGGVSIRRRIAGLPLEAAEEWSAGKSGLVWDVSFEGVPGGPGAAEKPAGHEVVLELPLLSPDLLVFTPGERGVMSPAAYPTFTPSAYGSLGWDTGRCYVLPLVTVLDPRSDGALTVALPPDRNIPHLQVEWSEARVLRLRLGHRGMGPGRRSGLRVLFYAHPADPRSALRAYSDDFPRHFRPGLPRGPHEGAFWYHHIQDHPDFEEMARQGVRFTWSSFWFPYLGEYLPAEKEWHPYTYARWWKLGQTMDDAKIRSFVLEMHRHGIGTFAYFNLTEYGGGGGAKGDSGEADRTLRERFAPALIRDERGETIATWEGARAMNPGPDRPFFPHLLDQVQRHLDRLQDIDGFSIDRLDWASGYDHGHRDGLTMIGGREAENLAVPVARAMAEVCRRAHAAGKRVYANQFYRLEVLEDVDGYCHEMDYSRGIGYLSPFRPAAAWHQARPYDGDLLAFEGQLKCRLHFALFPQMIAHRFPISQQAPSPRAADLLEVYSPLFRALDGKEEVLLPRCVEVSGANLARLYTDRAGRYVAPITSRVRFLSRGGGPEEEVTLRLRVPGGRELSWAQVLSADSPPRRARLAMDGEAVRIDVPGHVTASVAVAGSGEPPPLDEASSRTAAEARERLLPALRWPDQPGTGGGPEPSPPAGLPEARTRTLVVRGAHLEAEGKAWLSFAGTSLGELGKDGGRFPLAGPSIDPSGPPPVLEVATGDEGTWFAVERAEVLAGLADGRTFRVARWVPATGEVAGFGPFRLRLVLRPCPPREVFPSKAVFQGKDARTGGGWKGKYGARAAWVSPRTGEGGNGYRLEVNDGKPHIWAEATDDPRALLSRADTAGAPRRAAAWFHDPTVKLSIVPPDSGTYRLAVYLLDFDRNGRALEASISGETGPLDARRAGPEETAAGVYLTWTASGPVDLEVRKVEGFNSVASGVFIDPE